MMGAGVALAYALGLGQAHADPWDFAFHGDESAAGTRNVLFHGSEQVHDLFGLVADQDWYRVVNRPFSSYQMVVDGMTSDLDLTAASVQRLNATGGLVLESALVTDAGGVLSLQWQQGSGTVHNAVRVRNAACDGSCEHEDTYRIRFYDTTYTLPRFSNSGTQSTVLRVQNATERACSVTHHFLAPSGSLLATSGPTTVPARGLQVVDTTGLVGGAAGSMRVTHTCGYGGLSGKAVTVEPATGFTFDTQLVPRPH